MSSAIELHTQSCRRDPSGFGIRDEPTILIDPGVRQTLTLVAQLAHLADRVFLDLARGLEAQGLSQKMTADMFALALRSYRRRGQRSSESVTVAAVLVERGSGFRAQRATGDSRQSAGALLRRTQRGTALALV